MQSNINLDLLKNVITDDMTVGERIAKVRKGRGYTQENLAHKVGINRSTLADYESNKIRIFSDVVSVIAVALNVTPNVLLGFEQKDTEEKISLRYTKRIKKIQNFPEHKIKAILKTLDDFIKANEE